MYISTTEAVKLQVCKIYKAVMILMFCHHILALVHVAVTYTQCNGSQVISLPLHSVLQFELYVQVEDSLLRILVHQCELPVAKRVGACVVVK